MIIMHFIVNETNNTQVFQGQHLTEHHYKEKKKKKKLHTKHPNEYSPNAQTELKTECKY